MHNGVGADDESSVWNRERNWATEIDDSGVVGFGGVNKIIVPLWGGP